MMAALLKGSFGAPSRITRALNLALGFNDAIAPFQRPPQRSARAVGSLYANVRRSVWAFLENQGVRWLYPDEHGDFVPTGKGVSLDGLPLR